MARCRFIACRARCPAQPFIQIGALLLRPAGQAVYVVILENFKNDPGMAGVAISGIGLKFSRNAGRLELVQDRLASQFAMHLDFAVLQWPPFASRGAPCEHQ